VLCANIEREKADRFRFVRLLYEKSGGDELRSFDMWELGTELGLDKEATKRITHYLHGERLVEYRGIGGSIGLTHHGIKEMEQALSQPDRATTHFPAAVNVIHIVGDVVGSQIQQGTQKSQQVQINKDTQREIAEFLAKLEKTLPEIKVETDTLRNLEADIQTVKAQLGAVQPKRSIVREALSSIRSVLVNAGATLLAAEATKLLLHLV
jgi:hypothetical protein